MVTWICYHCGKREEIIKGWQNIATKQKGFGGNFILPRLCCVECINKYNLQKFHNY